MKKIVTMFFAVCLIVMMCCATAMAADIPDPAPGVKLRICGLDRRGEKVFVSDHTDFVDGWSTAIKLAQNGEELTKKDFVRVVVDIYEDWTAVKGEFCNKGTGFDWDAIYFPKGVKVTWNLNGHTINRGLTAYQYNGEVICIDEEADVIINNGTITGGFSGNGAGGIHIKEDAVVTLNDVNLKGNTVEDDDGAAVAVYDGAVFTMNGGSISDNLVYAFFDTFEMSRGALFVSKATAILKEVTISGNKNRTNETEGVAVTVVEGGKVTLDACIVEENGFPEDGKSCYAGSILYCAGENSELHVTNNTKFRNNGVSGTYGSFDTPTALFYVEGLLSIDGCEIQKNNTAVLFRVVNPEAVTGDIKNTIIKDNESAVFGIKMSVGEGTYTFTDCQFNNNKGKESEYTFEGHSKMKISLQDCDLGDSTFANKKYIEMGSKKSGSMLAKGSVSAILSLTSICLAFAAIIIVLVDRKKRMVVKNGGNA